VFLVAVFNTGGSNNLDGVNLAVRGFMGGEKATGRLPDQIPAVTGGALI